MGFIYDIYDIYDIYPPKVADALGLQNLFAYAFENTKIIVKIYLRSNISPSCRFRSHRSICLLVTVISLEKMLPRHKTMFVVVSAGVQGKINLNNWRRYRVQLVLPFFFCTPPSVRDSLSVRPKMKNTQKLGLFCRSKPPQ